MSLLRSRRFHTTLGVAVSGLLLAWIVSMANWSEVLRAAAEIRGLYLIPLLFVYALHFYLRAVRWHYLLPLLERPAGLRSLFDAILVGGFASYILPLRAGEFVRPYLLARESDHSFSAGFVSVVVERFFDLSAVLLTFGIVILFLPAVPDALYLGAGALGGVAFGIFCFMVLGSFFPERVMAVVSWCARLLPASVAGWAHHFAGELLRGAAVLSRPRNLLAVVSLTALVWFSCYATFYIFLLMFSLEPSWLLATSLAVIIALAVALPSAPGFLGVYQSGCIAAFALFTVDRDSAIAFSLVTHAIQYVLVVLYGIWALWSRSLSISELRSPA